MIKLITYPDLIYNKSHKLMLFCASDELKIRVQEQLFPCAKEELQIYLVEPTADEEYIKWVMGAFAICDIILADADNVSETFKNIFHYMLAYQKTFYLTKGNSSVYNMLSANRIHDFEFIKNTIQEIV